MEPVLQRTDQTAYLGDILHYRVYNKHTVILNSYDNNVELLAKRSVIYSDRSHIPILDLLVHFFL